MPESNSEKIMYLGVRFKSAHDPNLNFTEEVLTSLNVGDRHILTLDEPPLEKRGFEYSSINRYADGFEPYIAEVEIKEIKTHPFDLEHGGINYRTKSCLVSLSVPRIGADIGRKFRKRAFPLEWGYRYDGTYMFRWGTENWSGIYATLELGENRIIYVPVDVFLDKVREYTDEPHYNAEDAITAKIGGVLLDPEAAKRVKEGIRPKIKHLGR